MTVATPKQSPWKTIPSNPVDSDELADRKAQYAAWRDRLKKRDDEVIDLDEPAPSKWSVESLFDQDWSASDS